MYWTYVSLSRPISLLCLFRFIHTLGFCKYFCFWVPPGNLALRKTRDLMRSSGTATTSFPSSTPIKNNSSTTHYWQLIHSRFSSSHFKQPQPYMYWSLEEALSTWRLLIGLALQFDQSTNKRKKQDWTFQYSPARRPAKDLLPTIFERITSSYHGSLSMHMSKYDMYIVCWKSHVNNSTISTLSHHNTFVEAWNQPPRKATLPFSYHTSAKYQQLSGWKWHQQFPIQVLRLVSQ
jgi:hypothetical protein